MPKKRGQVDTLNPFDHVIESFSAKRHPPVPPGVMRSIDFKAKIMRQSGVGMNMSKSILQEMINAGEVERFHATYMVDGKRIQSRWVRVLS